MGVFVQGLEVNRFFEIEIPIPPKPIQQSIVDNLPCTIRAKGSCRQIKQHIAGDMSCID